MAKVYSKHDDELLVAVGLPAKEVAAWRKEYPLKSGSFAVDRKRFSSYWQKTARLRDKLPPHARQSDREDLAARLLHGAAIEARKAELDAAELDRRLALASALEAQLTEMSAACERATAAVKVVIDAMNRLRGAR